MQVTLFVRLPRIESYFSRCASVFESVMSFTATISMSRIAERGAKNISADAPKTVDAHFY